LPLLLLQAFGSGSCSHQLLSPLALLTSAIRRQWLKRPARGKPNACGVPRPISLPYRDQRLGKAYSRLLRFGRREAVDALAQSGGRHGLALAAFKGTRQMRVMMVPGTHGLRAGTSSLLQVTNSM